MLSLTVVADRCLRLAGTGGCLQDSDCGAGEMCDYEVETGLFVCMPVPTPQPVPSAGEVIRLCHF